LTINELLNKIKFTGKTKNLWQFGIFSSFFLQRIIFGTNCLKPVLHPHNGPNPTQKISNSISESMFDLNLDLILDPTLEQIDIF
jgi:hypothetical protein